MRQPKLPLNTSLLYECANPECYYCDALLDMEDVTWKEIWNSELRDLDLIPHCPSCNEPMMIWSENDGKI